MPKLCSSTFLWGAILFAMTVTSTIMLQNIPFATISIIASFLTLYAVQCICVGGCWMLSWFHPITYPTIIILFFIAAVSTLGISMKSVLIFQPKEDYTTSYITSKSPPTTTQSSPTTTESPPTPTQSPPTPTQSAPSNNDNEIFHHFKQVIFIFSVKVH